MAKHHYSGRVPDTVEEFAKACEGLSNDQIYDLFENIIRIHRPKLHSEIYSWSDPEGNEPFRAACDAIGHHYNIQSLMEY
jgi:hypothetical protein